MSIFQTHGILGTVAHCVVCIAYDTANAYFHFGVSCVLRTCIAYCVLRIEYYVLRIAYCRTAGTLYTILANLTRSTPNWPLFCPFLFLICVRSQFDPPWVLPSSP